MILPPEEEALIPTVAENLETCLKAFKQDHAFLLKVMCLAKI